MPKLNINGRLVDLDVDPATPLLWALRADQKIVTIEGLSPNVSHPVQKAWLALDVPQCGYCQAGMIMAVAALLKDKPRPTDAEIDAEITNICRCGTYNRVRAAIHPAVGGGVAGGRAPSGGWGEGASVRAQFRRRTPAAIRSIGWSGSRWVRYSGGCADA